jgi:hypothetical protein
MKEWARSHFRWSSVAARWRDVIVDDLSAVASGATAVDVDVVLRSVCPSKWPC